MRLPGDCLFLLLGVGAFAWFLLGLWRGYGFAPVAEQKPSSEAEPRSFAAWPLTGLPGRGIRRP
jgi:hypothetical protein